jgi:hypothetical protein
MHFPIPPFHPAPVTIAIFPSNPVILNLLHL